MQRDRVTGLVNMGVIQYLYLPVQNVLPQLPSFPKCVSVQLCSDLNALAGLFFYFFFSPVLSAHSGLFRGGEKISQ
jgi:hypothetical protein